MAEYGAVRTITAIETQRRDPERVNVYLDGEFAFGFSRLVAVSRGLVEGRSLSPAEVEALRAEDDVEKAFNAALNFLSFRPRSRREIEDYFRRRKLEPEVGVAVVERLERIGVLDDREFARFWVENRQTFRPRGTRALKAELRQKGIESEIIDDTLADIGDEEETAYQAGIKKARSYRTADEREFFRKMLGFLQRRGFPYGPAAAASRRIYREMTSADPETELPAGD
jgi:regulatory protein